MILHVVLWIAAILIGVVFLFFATIGFCFISFLNELGRQLNKDDKGKGQF